MSAARTTRLRVPADVAEAVLGTAPKAFRTGSTEIMLAALARAVRGYQCAAGIVDDRPISVQLEGHGRDHTVLAHQTGQADLTRTVGWFTTIAPVLLDPGADAVHAVKAAKEEIAGQPDGAGFGMLRYGPEPDPELARRPLPSIGFNFLGAGTAAAATPDSADELADDLVPAADGPSLPATVSGRMRPANALAFTVSAVPGEGGRELVADIGYDDTVLDLAAASDIGARWAAELGGIVAAARAGGIGLSPSDVPGSGLTQADLDALARTYPEAQVWGLSPLQRGFYFQHELVADDAQGLDVYSTQAVIEFTGHLDRERLRTAVAALLDRHRVLRSGYIRTESGAIAAVVPDSVSLPFEIHETPDAAAVAALAGAERYRPFDLAAPPVVRFVLAAGHDHDSLVVTNHHILFDGWSGPLVLADLLSLYGTGAPAVPDEPDFADYLAHLADTDREAGLAAWRDLLADLDGPTLVGTGAGVSADEPPAEFRFGLGADLTAELGALGREQQVTPSTILQAAWAVFLSRLTGNRTVCFGETVSGRPAGLDGVESMIGLFINTLPVAARIAPDRTVAELLDGMQRAKVDVLDHQHVSLAEISAAVGQNVLFDTLTLHESYPIDVAGIEAATPGDVAISDIAMADASHYPLNLYTQPVADDISATLKYLPGEFTGAQVEAFADVYRQILRVMVADPARRLGDIDPASERARTEALARARGPVVEVARTTLPDTLAAQVAATPDAPALRLRDRVVDYREFGARVNSLARELIGLGVGPEDAVAVCMPRSVEMLVALHAIVAAGGQYVPVDTEAPPERTQQMFDTAGVSLALVVDPRVEPLRGTSARVVAVDADGPVDPAAADVPVTDADRRAPLRPAHAAYTLFTSGSTGVPKGVTLSHEAVLNRLYWGNDEFGWAADDVVMLKTPYTFDCSVPELFEAFMVGAQVVIAEPGGHADPVYLAELVASAGVTSIHFVPSMLSVFNDVVGGLANGGSGTDLTLSSLRWIYTTGEALPPAVAARTRELVPGADFYNLYGPTEAAIEITYEQIETVGERVGIGVPMWNSTAYVLDERLRPVPPGMPGELYLGGVQLARGYAARADLTAERFVADPFGGPGSRLYRTGDLVRILPGAAGGGDRLEYLGRTDFQVKLRGQRIELGEIESAIAAAPGVVHAAATVVTAPGGGEHLVGYYAPADVAPPTVAAAVALALPEYMHPTVWVPLDDIVLNTAGKLDRNALPAPEFTADTGFRPAATAAEEVLVDVFADVLGLSEVSADAGFFDIGGNSLTATQLAGRLTALTGERVGVRLLFDNPTPAALARALDLDGAIGLGEVSVAERPERPDRLPLSLAQQRMWFLNTFDPDTTAYNLPLAMRITGDVEDAAMAAAVNDLLGRHEVLRTRYPAGDDGRDPVQEIVDLDTAVVEIGFSRRVVADVGTAVAEFLGQTFDVTRQIPVRVALFTDGDAQVLASVVHHIAADGVSLGILGADLMTAYAARVSGREPGWERLPLQFADVALLQRERLGSVSDPGSELSRQFEHWREELAGIPEIVEIPGDRPRPPVATQAGGSVDFAVPAGVVAAVGDLARSVGATDFMVVHAALAALISRLAGTDDVVIGTPVAGRGDPETAGMVGMFVNTLVLRTLVDPAADARALIGTVRAADERALANADIPFEYLVEELAPTRTEAHTPLFGIQLAFQNFADGAAGQAQEVAGLTVDPVAAPTTAVQNDLTFVLAPDADGGWTGRLPFATDLYDAHSAQRLADRFVAVLTALATAPELPVGDIALLDDDERRRVAQWESGAVREVDPTLLPDHLVRRAAANPEAVALVFEDRSVTYGEFAARVAELGRRLVDAGIGPEDAVAVCLPRSVEMLVALHGVIAAGGQYVPIDPQTPADRVEYMLATVGARTVLVGPGDESGTVAQTARAAGAQLVIVDASGGFDPGIVPITDAQRLTPLRPDHAVYTLFTSGSTGRPKGVTLTHEAVLNRLWWGLDEIAWRADDVVVQKTPYTFDCSVTELFAPILAGATLVIARPGGHADPRYLAQLLESQRVTSVHFVPSMLSVFLDVVPREQLARLTELRYVSTTGEALPPAVAAQVLDSLDVDLWNLYGPTEAAVEITYQRVTEVGAVVPIGAPVWNSTALVLDARLAPVPPGVAGELYLGGVQLARGYAARGDLTAERFVANPLGAPGERMYRTGDLVRWNASGGLEYLGRTDFQVKLRGQRIELGEIESAMAAAPGVVHAAATVVAGPGGTEHLVGYVSAAGGPEVDVASVKAAVGAVLPSYMVPTVWVPLDDVVLNSAGKLDRKALPAPDFTALAAEFVAPRNPREAAVAAAYAEVLGLSEVSVTESFFDLGGNSLSATKLAARAGDALGVDISVRDVFEAPTVRELLRGVGGDAPAGLPPITAAEPRPARIPLTNAQRRMWFINRFDPASGAYNIPIGLRVRGPLDIDALRAALDVVLSRHEVLRTLFPAHDGVPHQLVLPADDAAELVDWAVVGDRAALEAAATDGFDLVDELPIRVRLQPVADDEHILLVMIHHIAGDGQSGGVLARALIAAYAATAAGGESQADPLPIQVADVAIWEERVLGSADDSGSVLGAELDYWRKNLEAAPDLLELPTDFPRPAVASTRGASVGFEIPADLAAAIAEFSREHRVTPFMVVHTALAALLARLSGTGDIVIGSPVAGRGRRELDGLVGMFVNTLVLRTAVDPGVPLGELLDQVRDVDLAAFEHAHLPFEYLVTELAPTRSEAFAPLAQVLLTVEDGAGDTAGLTLPGGLAVEPLTLAEEPARVDLTVGVGVAPAGQPWGGRIAYAADLFTDDSVSALGRRIVAILGALVAAPDTPVGAVPLLDDAEQRELVPMTTGRAVPPVLLADLFAAAVADAPDTVAVVDGLGVQLTYRELDERSTRLARWLIARGVGAEQIVALLIPRSAMAYTAVWAVAKTGAAYVSIDPDYPPQRVANMLEDSGAVLALTVDGIEPPDGAPATANIGGTRLLPDIAAQSSEPLRAAELAAPVDADNLAYVIYTSGSTGRPKGVSVSHRGLANFAAAQHAGLRVERGARVLGFASPSFDASVLEYLMAVTARGTIAYRPTQAVGGAELQAWMTEQRVEHGFLTPSVLATLDPRDLPDLKALMAGGEAVPAALVGRWAPHVVVHNLYGPTETTIGVTLSPPLRDTGGPVLLGGAIPGIALLVLDGRLQPVPYGVAGELYVAGAGLSRGYLDRPGLSAERFVANPHGEPGERMYRTGDVVRWVRGEDGTPSIEYVGRSDDQVKLRGLRIELGEIQGVLAAHADVASAAVVGVGGSSATALAAYLVPVPGRALDVDRVRTHAAAALPAYMVPGSITVIDELPMTPVGKLDTAALPEPVFAAADDYVEPATDAEHTVAAIVADLLDIEVDGVGATASFFDLGGNSLSATRLAARVGEAFGTEVGVRDVFEAPTVRDLARIATAATGAALAPVVAVVPRPDEIPLSFAQQRMWFLNQFEPASPAYNIPLVLRLVGDVDLAALRAAFDDVVDRHEVLRTVYPAVDGAPTAVIAAADSAAQHLDWQVVDSFAGIESAVTTGFDVSRQWPVRVRVWPGADGVVLAVVAHHIAADGESLQPLTGDLVRAYAARSAGRDPGFEPLEVQFADFALWQQRELGTVADEDSVLAGQFDYWQRELAGLPDLVELPGDRPRPPVATHRGALVRAEIPASVVSGIERLARASGATEFMVFHAALAALIGRLAAADDVAIGASSAGRGRAVLDPLVGMFVNTLVLRTAVDPKERFADFLEKVKTIDTSAFANADVPFESLVDALNPVRSEAFAPLTQVLVFFNRLGGLSTGVDLPGLSIEQVEAPTVSSRVDLTVQVSAGAAGQPWSLGLEYATDLFDAATVARFADRLVTVLAEATADPARAVGDIEILQAPEAARLERVESGERRDVPALPLVTDAVFAQIEATPEAVALVAEDGRELTYRAFGARVSQLARRLIAAGVGPDDAVALSIPRSIEMVIAIHAIVAAGGQYVPVDTGAVAQRVEHMLDAAGVSVVLTADAVGAAPAVVEVAGSRGARVLDFTADEPLGEEALLTAAERRGAVSADNAVYTLFTSGSTGVPKGVTLSHAAVLNRLWWGLAALPIDEGDVVVLKTPYTFDVSVPELFAPLMTGARMLVLGPQTHLDPRALADAISRARATMVHFVPSMLGAFLDVVGPARLAELDSVRIMSFTGEALPPASAAAVRDALPQSLLFNLYGPTEAAVEITAEPIESVDGSATSVAIGTPVWNSSAIVLDSRLRRVPEGVAGELYLGGVQLARGYAARPDLTADRFVADPFGEPGARMYRTGDLVRRRPDGVLEYLGRTDFQVKLRGQRVELGEIEAVMGRAPGVVHVAATVHETSSGEQHLVGYYSPSSVSSQAIGETVRAALPGYMVPTVWVGLDDVVLNAAGKLDRKALPEPEFAVTALIEPTSPIEETIADVVAAVLHLDRVGVTDSFFDIGGNSLSATRVAARVGEALGADVTVRDVFEAPTVRGLAARVGTAATRAPLVAGPRPEHIPLAYAQQRMWFLNRFDPASPAYNIPVALRVPGGLDVEALRAALVDVVSRHEVLRTVYPVVDGTPVAQIVDERDAAARFDWAVTDTAEEALAVGARGFDVGTDLPIRARVAADGADHVLVIVVHHIATDAESMPVFTRDLGAAYAARANGVTPTWAPLPIQYADYALWQREQLGDPDDEGSILAAQIRYWSQTLAELPEVVDLPADRRRPAVADLSGAQLVFDFGPQRSAAVHTTAAREGVTPFMVLHAALAATVARLASTDDVAIGAAVAGRGQEALDDLVGMFVNTVVLRTRHGGGDSGRALLQQVSGVAMEAFTHADVPFEQVVEALAPNRSTAHAPLFQVGINYLVDAGGAAAGDTAADGGTELRVIDDPAPIAKVDLQAAFTETAGRGLRGGLTYATALFDEATIAAFRDTFLAILDAVTADPDAVVADIDILDEQDRRDLVPVLGDRNPLAPATAREIFARRALDPRRPAVVEADRALDYAGFESLTNRLARELIGRGAGPETVIGIGMPRSLEAAVLITAILKAGAAYLPLDPGLPPERLAHMVADADPLLIAVRRADRDVFEFAGQRLITVGDLAPRPDAAITPAADLTVRSVSGHPDLPVADAELSGRCGVDSLAYLVYTSGSTGRPKAVAVSHRGLSRLNQQHREWTRELPDTRVLAVAAIGFDGAFFELFAAFGLGLTLVVAPADVYAGEGLVEVISRHRVTDAVITPAVLATMDPARASSLRHLGTAGEAVAPEVVARWAPGRELFNGYGPTETTVSATGAILTAGRPIRIGRPVPGMGAVVLDERLRSVGRGVVGELYLLGDKLARGYHGQPGLTAARFVANPFGDYAGQRMYRTGDLVRWTGDPAELEFVGRSDHQVKINGQRVELGEIDAALAEQPGVATAVTIGVTDRHGRSRLAGYLVAEPGAAVDVAAVADALRLRLPAYMVPAALVVIDELPLTVIGKLDRRRLPEPEFPDDTGGYEPPANEVERLVAEVFAEVLGVDRVSVAQSFFDAGGNSLSATRVVGALRNRADADLSLATLFADPTPRGVAAALAGSAGVVNDVLITLRADGGAPPLFCIHPAGGLAWFYGGLAPYVANRPVYGLQDPHVVLDEPEASSVPELAQRYVREIRAVQPRGPYHLLGWSIGGHVAHAVAVALQAAGESVAYLGLMDAAVAEEGAPADTGTAETDGAPTPDVGDLLGGWRELFQLDEGVTVESAEEVAEVVRDQIEKMGLLRPGQVDRVMDSFANAARIGSAYEPPVFDGDLHVFTATADKADPATVAAGWRGRVTGRVINVDVDTHHLGMADADSLAVIGPAVQDGLDAAAHTTEERRDPD
ncbi:amino acid adenylation domain-containing protein [Gordonia sp. X0973]|uniref:non-ribosomal peptide synthetase n=1 Tax=Gordonia sp. X0973 TaxID=2742602 RepID=UPI000F536404|nr:non-ribosomal peptide synthetase [Gordonia sp. X0973]QKT08192.1 amino acid adenylation domain-containing protein [Gordonia sp. X0973]